MSTRKNTSAQNAQAMEQMMEQMMQMMQDMQARMNALESAQATATPKSEPKACKDDKVAFTKADGTVIYGTAKQVANWERYRNRNLTEGQKSRIKAIEEGKLQEPKRTRALEKALKVKANSFANTAITLTQALDAGWKPKATDRAGRRAELKAIKERIRNA